MKNGKNGKIGKKTKKKVEVGDLAPDFTLPDQNGKDFRLKDLIGKSAIVLYFYPKDDTPGCKTEACTFRDQYNVFKDYGAEVIGISSDSIESHKKFEQKYNLPFSILSDKNGKVRKVYGAHSTLGLIPGRVTYIIDTKGVIKYVFSSQLNAKAHVNNSLKILLEIKAGQGVNKTLDIKI